MTRWQVPVVLGAVVVGFTIGIMIDVGDQAERLVVPALVALLALTFAGIHSAAFADAVRPHPRTAWVSLVLNFVRAPLFAGALGWALLSDEPRCSSHPVPTGTSCSPRPHAETCRSLLLCCR